jgi:ribosomal protein S18 acetylase RimI-like enzyme
VPLTRDEIRALEALADRAWPAAETEPCDGWELRATGPGIGRRVNSVAPLADGTLPLAERIARAEAFYRARGLPPIFKLTAAALPAGLEDALVTAGYRVDAPVSVRTRALPLPLPAGPARLEAHPSEQWQQVNAAAGEHCGSAPQLFLELVTRIQSPRLFVSVEDQGETAAVGMGVAQEEWVNVFEIGTHPVHRRRGLARRVLGALLAWGAEQGARRAYLQVMPENRPALALYEGLGFEEAYRYWYRVAPAAPGRPSAGT